MAYIKKRLLVLSSGRKIKLTGIGLFISADHEIGEGFTNSLFSPAQGDAGLLPANPYRLTKGELHEIADMIIKSAVQFKDYLNEKLPKNDAGG
jgi:hypothetical protein